VERSDRRSGVDINVIRMLRGARREVRGHRLASFLNDSGGTRGRWVPRDRVLSASTIAHRSRTSCETAGTVLNRIGSRTCKANRGSIS
jgi:hypothetical protein